jgi:hypothetical protein
MSMTKFDANWVKAEEAKRKYMAENGLYSEAEEHASCGCGACGVHRWVAKPQGGSGRY